MLMIRNISIVAAVLYMMHASALQTHAATEQCLLLVQNSQTHGMHSVIISKNAVKIVGKTTEYTILMKAPRWNVLLFSKNKKVYHESSPENWNTPLGDAHSIMARVRFENCKMIEQGKTQFLKLSCKRIAINPGTGKKGRGEKYGNVLYNAEFLTCETLGISAQVSSVLCQFYGVPKVKGMPIRLSCKNEIGHDEVLLTTISTKTVPMQASEFEPPSKSKGYRLAKSSREVVMDSSKTDMIQNIVDGLGESLEKK